MTLINPNGNNKIIKSLEYDINAVTNSIPTYIYMNSTGEWAEMNGIERFFRYLGSKMGLCESATSYCWHTTLENLETMFAKIDPFQSKLGKSVLVIKAQEYGFKQLPKEAQDFVSTLALKINNIMNLQRKEAEWEKANAKYNSDSSKGA